MIDNFHARPTNRRGLIMTNHSKEPFGEDEKPKEFKTFKTESARLRELLNTTGFRGALGDFPEPRLTPDDEGAIQFAIGSKDDKVVLDFGTQVHWIAMTPQQAAELASSLLNKAREVGRRNGESVAFVIRSAPPTKRDE